MYTSVQAKKNRNAYLPIYSYTRVGSQREDSVGNGSYTQPNKY